MLTKIKSVLNNLRRSGAEITRNVVIAVRNDVLSGCCLGKMTKNGGTKTFGTEYFGKKDRNNCEKRDESR